MKEWEREIMRQGKEWGLMSLDPPNNTKHYLNHFTSTMKQISWRFIEGPWKGLCPAFIQALGKHPTTAPAQVTHLCFISADQMAHHIYQWYNSINNWSAITPTHPKHVCMIGISIITSGIVHKGFSEQRRTTKTSIHCVTQTFSISSGLCDWP
jgi:hypothetical protein